MHEQPRSEPPLSIDSQPIKSGLFRLERIYVVRSPGEEGVTVKRVALSGRQLICTPDNEDPSHLPLAVDLDEHALSEVLVGRVVWWANEDL
jgi:hypothetical protein